MEKRLGRINLLLWVGIILFFLWFLIFSLAPKSILTTLDFIEVEGYFLRMFGILPLGWAILFLFALKHVEKNIAILNCEIITAALMILTNIIYHFVVENVTSWFLWGSLAVLFLYNVLLYLIKPKTSV